METEVKDWTRPDEVQAASEGRTAGPSADHVANDGSILIPLLLTVRQEEGRFFSVDIERGLS